MSFEFLFSLFIYYYYYYIYYYSSSYYYYFYSFFSLLLIMIIYFILLISYKFITRNIVISFANSHLKYFEINHNF